MEELLAKILMSSVPTNWESYNVATYEFNEVFVRVWFGDTYGKIVRIEWIYDGQFHIVTP